MLISLLCSGDPRQDQDVPFFVFAVTGPVSALNERGAVGVGVRVERPADERPWPRRRHAGRSRSRPVTRFCGGSPVLSRCVGTWPGDMMGDRVSRQRVRPLVLALAVREWVVAGREMREPVADHREVGEAATG